MSLNSDRREERGVSLRQKPVAARVNPLGVLGREVDRRRIRRLVLSEAQECSGYQGGGTGVSGCAEGHGQGRDLDSRITDITVSISEHGGELALAGRTAVGRLEMADCGLGKVQ